MANDYFRFKHFIVYQDKCGFKVNTDSCLFGAVVDHPYPARILDIGTGTGLLALMMAQRFPEAMVDAVEIDPNSANQASQNFDNSEWRNRINLKNLGILEFIDSVTSPYDLVLTNPPWYINHQKSPNRQKNLARHGDRFLLEELSSSAVKLTGPAGIYYAILPLDVAKVFAHHMDLSGFTASRQIMIRSGKDQPPTRTIIGYTWDKLKFPDTEITVHEKDGNYTMEFKLLLRDFYPAF